MRKDEYAAWFSKLVKNRKGMEMRGIQEIFATPIEAFQRASDIFHGGDRSVVVIESAREPGKYFVENNSPMVRPFERIIWANGGERK